MRTAKLGGREFLLAILLLSKSSRSEYFFPAIVTMPALLSRSFSMRFSAYTFSGRSLLRGGGGGGSGSHPKCVLFARLRLNHSE